MQSTDPLLERRARLSPEKQALLLKRLRGANVPGSEHEQIPPRSRTGPAVTSFAQQRMWFLDRFNPGSSAYNVPISVRLGPVNIPAMAQALSEIVRRHHVLRTTFAESDGPPVQVVAPYALRTMPVVDLSVLSDTQAEETSLALLKDELWRPFNLERGPVLRIGLLRLSERHNIAFATMTHIVTDGWSTGIFISELSVLYDCFSRAKVSSLTEPAIQYTDYAEWQREWTERNVVDRDLGYWKQRLSGIPAALELPGDRPRPRRPSFEGLEEFIALPASLSNDVRDLCQRTRLSLFMVMLGAFQILLRCYARQEDIVVGAPIANRRMAELEGLIGYFSNTLAIRSTMAAAMTCFEFLAQVRENALGGYAHQDLPFERLVEELQPERTFAHTPLFQVLFVFLGAEKKTGSARNVSLDMVKVHGRSAKFDLTLWVTEREELIAALEYQKEVFDGVTIRRMLGHFERILAAISTDTAQTIGELQMLGKAEHQQILKEWAGAADESDLSCCLHQLITRQADLTPDRIAVAQDGRQLSYAELNRRSGRLANFLSASGVRAEAIVALYIERSVEMVIGLLGTLRAGAAYLPIDPASAADRNAYMIEESGARFILTQELLVDRMPPARVPLICLDRDWDIVSSEPSEAADDRAGSFNAAYVIYTSGSTGNPKGVVIEHRQIVAYSSAVVERLQLYPESNFAMVQPLTFDSCLTCVVPALTIGGTLHILPSDLLSDAEAVSRQIAANAIDCMKITPSHLGALWESRHRSELLPKRRLVFGGESSEWEWIREIQALAPRCAIFNHYGPTETTVGSLVYRLSPDRACRETGSVPIGRPLGNTRAYVVDPWLHTVPAGVPGELCIGGRSVARGYLNHGRLTAEKFTPDPFGGEFGGRSYRTGDLARYRADGAVEFLGRIDHQIKIRGYRVELGEIESALSNQDGVLDVAVAATDSAAGKQLVGYVVTGQPGPETGALLRRLKEKLPDYMVPAAIVKLTELPLMASGKVDRRALPPPSLSAHPGDNAADSFSPTEELVRGIWSRLLGITEFGLNASFFELGGHSLLGARLISRLREAFQVDLPLSCLFEDPTVAGLSARVESARRLDESLALPPLAPAPRNQPLPLSLAQEAMWFFEQMDTGANAYALPAAFGLTGPLVLGSLEQGLNEVVRRHEVLRTSFPSDGGRPIQMISEFGHVALCLIDLTAVEAGDRDAALAGSISLEARRGFDLERGPLLRRTLLKLGERDHVLLLTLHHIVTDGWSTGILINEMAALYDSFSSGRPSPLPDLRIQYADYAGWQRQWADDQFLSREIEYWSRELAGAPRNIELPIDRPRPALRSFQGAAWSFSIDPEMSAGLRRITREEDVTLFMTVFSAFCLLLYGYSGDDDMVVGTSVANRHPTELEKLIGLFVNSVGLRIRMSAGMGFRELLDAVRRASLGAYDHQNVAFSRIVEELRPDRDSRSSPLFQVMFVLQNTPAASLRQSDLGLRALNTHSGMATYDLIFYAIDTGTEIEGLLQYDTDLFDESTIVRMERDLKAICQAIIDGDGESLSALSALMAPEAAGLLADFNASMERA
ncbi:MAG TPA: amino acid adenylation domain-containing protein [Blastocatellia bacterium]|nr:amino acid adenylation domain-containing protein [Blastocatellia bacterium]